MDVMLTYTHLENLLDSGYKFYIPLLSGVGNGQPQIVLHPFKTEKDAINFASEKGLDVQPLDMSKLKVKAEISKAIEEDRCYIFNSASRQ